MRQLHEQGTDVVMVDTGNSYEGLCEYLGGKYISYTEEKPITMNPFKITKEEINIEKINFLKNLILQIWKGSEGVVTKTDKKGGKYVSFSAYSTEKSGDALQFTWVRFIKFDYVKEAFLEAKAKIHATGKLTVSAYNGRIDLDCRMEEVKPWERQPFTPSKDNENPPF